MDKSRLAGKVYVYDGPEDPHIPKDHYIRADVVIGWRKKDLDLIQKLERVREAAEAYAADSRLKQYRDLVAALDALYPR